MRYLFVLDYIGTLASLPNPVTYIHRLRGKHPTAKVVLYTGTCAAQIQGEHPGLLEVLDALWLKPDSIKDKIRGESYDHIVVVDDDQDQRALQAVLLHRHPVTILGVEDLPILLDWDGGVL